MWHWLYDFFGISGTGPAYAWWSGAGSDLGEVALIGGVVTILRHHNCNEHRCWRLGKHPVDGTPFKVCKRHHPDIDHTKPVRIGA